MLPCRRIRGQPWTWWTWYAWTPQDVEGGMNQRCAYRILQDLTGTKGSKHILSIARYSLHGYSKKVPNCATPHSKHELIKGSPKKRRVDCVFFQLHVDTTECVLSDWIRLNLQLWKCSRNSQLGEFIQDLVVRSQQRFRTLARRACKIVTYCRGHVFYHEKHSQSRCLYLSVINHGSGNHWTMIFHYFPI